MLSVLSGWVKTYFPRVSYFIFLLADPSVAIKDVRSVGPRWERMRRLRHSQRQMAWNSKVVVRKGRNRERWNSDCDTAPRLSTAAVSFNLLDLSVITCQLSLTFQSLTYRS